MKCWHGIAAILVATVSSAMSGHAQSRSAGRPNFSGVWILNRAVSDAPSAAAVPPDVSGQGGDRSDAGTGAGRGGLGGTHGRARSGRSGDRGDHRDRDRTTRGPDRRRTIEQLTSELMTSSPSLTISHADPVLIITNARERTRQFLTNRQNDPHQLGVATVLSTTRWHGDRLVTEYDLGSGRTIRVTHSFIPATKQLLEEVSFASGQTTKRIYDPARSTKRP
jgi:hypothetical protein